MSSFVGLLRRVSKALNPPLVPKDESTEATSLASRPIRFGILGAAKIAPDALILPVRSHPEATVYAVAARNPARAAEFAKKHSIPKVHSTYEDLLNDPLVDAVYNPLPNGLHYEWTMKALSAGKHVLLEKPSTNTAEETRSMFELAKAKGLILLETYHYRHHPAIQRVKEILDSGELGKIKHIENFLSTPHGFFAPDDIRFEYDLGGGALMDMGCYNVNIIRYLTGAPSIVSILDVSHELWKPASPPADYVYNVDRATTASLALPNDVTAKFTCDLGHQRFPPLNLSGFLPKINVIVECEAGKVELWNWIGPQLFHTITVTPKPGSTVKARTEKAYTFGGKKEGEDWWSTHRYQLESFVNRLRGREAHTWITAEDSIQNMEWIEKIYAEKGLGSRPKSTYVPNA